MAVNKTTTKAGAAKAPAGESANQKRQREAREKAAAKRKEQADKLSAKKKEQAAKKAAAAKAKEAEKAKAQAEKTKALAPLAKEINHRLTQAQLLDGKADDHRLSAAIQLAKAKDKCAELKVAFKDWCKDNVQQSYETVRKLVPIGAAPDPAKALADMREGNRQANKEHREKQKAEKALPKPSIGNNAPTAADALEMTQGMTEEDTLAVAKKLAEETGYAVVSTEDLEKLKSAEFEKAAPAGDPMEAAKHAFTQLPVGARTDFAQWVAQQIGATLNMDL